MGGKNQGKVHYFLMSIHYGLCHGPLDNLNKVWVKDKSILCGNYGERTNIPVNQPELFGGQDGEGGVVGEVEYYPGTDDQVSSPQLASRVGRTAANMPGYRGIASLFFRGKDWGPLPETGLISEQTSGIVDFIFPGVGRNTGFQWTANNPYLPGMKASVSRFSTTLGELNSKIYPVQDVVERPPDAAEDPSAVGVVIGLFYDIKSSEDGFIGAVYPEDFNESGPPFGINATLPPPPPNDPLLIPPSPSWASPLLTWTSTGGTDMFVNEAGDGRRFFYKSGFGAGTLYRDLDLATTLGASLTAVDAGQARVLVGYEGFRGGSFATYTSRVIALDENGVQLGAATTGGSAIGPGDPRIIETLIHDLPAGTRSIRVGATSQNAGVYPLGAVVEWKEPEIVFCDPDNEGLRLLPNANPAHIIHETLVNPEWGKGEDPARIDVGSFTAAAQTYKDEFFGLAFTWVRQGSVEDFVQQVLDHTRTMLFLHPRTGLWTLRPLRGDYDVPTVLAGRRLDPSNCTAKKRKRRAWGETVNEIVVKYTDPQTEDEATVASHNLANIAIQGGVISETRPYPGIRDEWLARFVADRDVVEAGHPLFSAEVEADREFWDVVPGDVLPLSWPEDGIEDMIVRVTNVDYGSPTKRTVKLGVAEDVFALEQTAYGPVQKSDWTSTRAFPEPVDAQIAMAAPLPLLVRSGFNPVRVDENYPAVGVMILGTDNDNQAIEIAVNGLVSRNDGSTVNETITAVEPSSTLLLGQDLPEEASSSIGGGSVAVLTLGDAEPGDLLLIGSAEDDQEIVMLGPYDAGNDTWTLWRGSYDTVPAVWPAGTRVWVLPEFSGQSDPSERAAGETVSYWLLPRTSEGRIPLGEATPISHTVSERPHLPFRPANVQIDGNGFALASYTSSPVSFPIPVTWANRNRTVEDQVARKWTDANVTPEAGQTTVIRVFDDQDVLAGEVQGLTGTSHDMTSGNFFGVTYGYLEFVSERDGFWSRAGARRWFDMRQGGFGNNYGVSYG